MISYGLTSKASAVITAQLVCDVLGHGSNNNAVAMLIETAQQETKLGSYPDDNPHKFGVGLCQFDRIAFNDVKVRTRKSVKDQIKRAFGIDIRKIEHRELAYSPLLSMVFCRLFYRLIPEVIPHELVGRAQYWKKYYNTAKGAGNWGEYLNNAKQIEVKYQ